MSDKQILTFLYIYSPIITDVTVNRVVSYRLLVNILEMLVLNFQNI